jgi:hypothetical protein
VVAKKECIFNPSNPSARNGSENRKLKKPLKKKKKKNREKIKG